VPEYVNRPDHKIAEKPEAVINYLIRLNRQGVSQRELANRFEIPRRTLRDYLKGNYAPPEKRAKDIATIINKKINDQAYITTIPTARGMVISLDPINKSDREKVKSYIEEIQKMERGEDYDLSKFKNMSIKVRGKKKMEKFKLVTDEETLNKMIEQGQAEDIKFFRNQGS
jgi:transcriptional regulator with XRE-family HTH domain